MSPYPILSTGSSPVYRAFLQLEAGYPRAGPCLANRCNPRSQLDPGPKWAFGTHYYPTSSLRVLREPAEGRWLRWKEGEQSRPGNRVPDLVALRASTLPKAISVERTELSHHASASELGCLSSSVGFTKYQLCELRKSLSLSESQFLSKVGGIPSNYYEDQVR